MNGVGVGTLVAFDLLKSIGIVYPDTDPWTARSPDVMFRERTDYRHNIASRLGQSIAFEYLPYNDWQSVRTASRLFLSAQRGVIEVPVGPVASDEIVNLDSCVSVFVEDQAKDTELSRVHMHNSWRDSKRREVYPYRSGMIASLSLPILLQASPGRTMTLDISSLENVLQESRAEFRAAAPNAFGLYLGVHAPEWRELFIVDGLGIMRDFTRASADSVSPKDRLIVVVPYYGDTRFLGLVVGEAIYRNLWRESL